MINMQGRVAIVFGIANKRSIAWAIAQKLQAAGATLAITYQNERLAQEAKDLIEGTQILRILRANSPGQAARIPVDRIEVNVRAADIGPEGLPEQGLQNFLLAARAEGLGAALTTLPLWSATLARRALGLPFGVQPIAVIPVGWPKGKYGPTTRRPVGDVVHQDRYGNRPPRSED